MNVSPTERLFRQLLQGDDTAAVLPGTDLLSLAQELDAGALGRLTVDSLMLRLQPELSLTESQISARQAITQKHTTLHYVFDAETANTTIQLLIKLAENQPGAGADYKIYAWQMRIAAMVVEGLNAPPAAELRESLREFVALQAQHDLLSFTLSAIAHNALPTSALGLMKTAEGAEQDSLFYSQELGCINALARKSPGICVQLARRIEPWLDGSETNQIDPRGMLLFAQLPEFVECSRPAIETATRIVENIHNGSVPYKADKAFSRVDAMALARFVNIALDREERWLPSLLDSLLEKVSVAPAENAKTVPSQTASYEIAKVIAERPDVSSWLILKRVSNKVRHATLKKRLLRTSKVAERNLTENAGFLKSWPVDLELPKALTAGVKRSFETAMIRDTQFSVDDFERLLENKGLAKIAETLIWNGRMAEGGQVLFSIKHQKKIPVYTALNGEHVSLDRDLALSVLHPLDAETGELEKCRDWLLDSKTRQPFNQLFRETYDYDESTVDGNISTCFSGYLIDAATLIGLSRSVGWHLSRYEGFKLVLGEYSIVFDCGDLYPGYSGTIQSGELKLFRGNKPENWRALSARLLSEAYRATDLLVSVAAFAVEDISGAEQDAPKTDKGNANRAGLASARSRVTLLKRLFPNSKQSGKPYIDGRYLCVKGVRIHCGTGRASNAGEAIEPQSKSVVQLPYQDKVLERIIMIVNSLEIA